MPKNVSPTTGDNSSHHLLLTDSAGTEVGLICVDGKGNRIPRVAGNPYPNMASQLRQGTAKHSDRVPPFEDIPQSDFSGGLASLHFDEDSSKYLDGKRCDTSSSGEVIHGGLESYTTGLRDFNESWSGDVSWTKMYASPGTESISTGFTANATYDVQSIVIILKKVGAPTGDITVQIHDASDNLVGTATKALTIDTDCLTDLVSERVEFTVATAQEIVDTTAYKVNIAYSGGDATNYIDVGVDGSDALYYRVLDDTDDFDGKFFEYNGGVYFVTQPLDRSASKIYLYGERGVADANTGHLDRLIDESKTWADDAWNGGVVKIVAEDGTEEREPYRSITDTVNNTDNPYLTVSPVWNILHTTETEYIILYPKWQLVETLSAYVTDVTVASSYVVLAFEGNDQIAKYEAKEFGGAFVEGLWDSDQAVVNHVLALTKDVKANGIQTNTLYGVHTGTSLARITKHNYLSGYRKESKTLAYQSTLMGDRMAFSDETFTSCTSYLRDTWIQIDMAAGVDGNLGRYTLPSPVDIRGGRYIRFIIVALTTARDAGDITLGVYDSSGNGVDLDLPALTANEAKLCELEFTTPPESQAVYDASDITDIYLKSTKSVEQSFYIPQSNPTIGVFMYGYVADSQWYLPMNTQINNMVEYAGGAGEVERRPWVFTWDGPWYLNGSNFTKLYLGELEELSHPDNGKGVCVNDVYLYFNAGGTIQRYYAGKLDNIGPDADYGLPSNRLGIPITAASYPGRVFYGIDAGESGYSSVIMKRAHGWHEYYRAPKDTRIRKIHAYARADTVDQLFVLEGADILWLPISINPLTESDYEYNHESVLETSRIYGGLRETEKYYHALTLVTENLSTTHRYMQVDYRTSENDTYTTIGTNFISSPRQRQALVSTNNVTGRWIQFRLRSYTDDRTETPKIVSSILDSLESLDVKDMLSYTVGIKAGYDLDLNGTIEDSTGEAILTQLKTWRNDPKPLTLNTVSPFEDDMLVKLENLGKRIRYKKIGTKEHELRLITVNLIEVS